MGLGTEGSADACTNNPPFKGTLSKVSGTQSFNAKTEENCDGSCSYASLAYIANSPSYRASVAFSGVPEGNFYSFSGIEYLSFEMFNSSSPNTHSGQDFTTVSNIWTDDANIYGDAYPSNNFYYCCGAYKEAKAGPTGTSWSNGDGTSEIVSNKSSASVCCDNLQCVGSDGACVNEGTVNPGHGYSGNEWLCGSTGSGPHSYSLFMKCDATKVGVTNSGKVCCGSGSTYAFQTGSTCGSGGGAMRVGDIEWDTNPGDDSTPYACSAYGVGSDSGCTDGSCCNDGSANALTGTCTDPEFDAAINNGVYASNEWICVPPMNGFSGLHDAPAFYHCTGARTYDTSTTPGFLSQPRGQYEGGGLSFCCVEKNPTTGVCGATFVPGSCVSNCGDDGSLCRCNEGPDVYIGDGSTYSSNTSTDQGWTWGAIREDPLSRAIVTPRNDLTSCDSGDSCVTLNSGQTGAAACYDVGEESTWDTNGQWLCGNDAGNNPAWYICHGGKVDHIYPGTDMCCKSSPYEFISSSESGYDTCCAADGTCNAQCAAGTDPDCGATCTSNCAPPNDRVCTGSNPSTFRWCRDLDGDGCYRWSYYQCGGATPICSDGSCIAPDCDNDNDGSNDARGALLRSGPQGLSSGCAVQVDCRSDQPTVRPGLSESANNYCTDGWDNDCEAPREADYDGSTSGLVTAREGSLLKGDSACPVGLSAITTDTTINTPAECAAPITVSCTANAGNLRSIEFSGLSGCSYSWSGTTVTFSCPRPADGSYPVTCFVNTAESYERDDATYDPSRSATIAINCNRVVSGVVRDAITHNIIGGATISYSGGSTTATSSTVDGTYSFPDSIAVGSYSFTATKAGYYAERRTTINVSAEPTIVDFNVTPEQCTAACTFAGVCDYKCIGQNGCTLVDPDTGIIDLDEDGVADSAAIIDTFKATCQGATSGSGRDFDADTIANCCRGPIEPKGLHETALTITSCASQLIPHQTIVNYNGKPHLLTVMSYRQCDPSDVTTTTRS